MKILNLAEQSQYGEAKVFSWIADKTRPEIEWMHFSTLQFPRLNQIKRPYLARYAAAFNTVRSARKTQADLIITHGTLMAVWVGIFKRLLNVKTRHLAWSFTLPYYNTRDVVRNAIMRFGVKNIDRFIMYSHIETRNYPQYLQLPADRFQMIPWSMNKPEFDRESSPLVKGQYIAAMGREGRDYKTLIQAMATLPDIKLVIVARPENLIGIEIPDNVEVMTNIPYPEAMNVAWHSKFMVLPLLSDTIPAGHGSLLAQFLYNKATIVTDSIAMEGYSIPGENVLVYKAQDAGSLKAQIETLWSQPGLAKNLAEKALEFAESQCTETNTVQYFHDYLYENNLLQASLSQNIINDSKLLHNHSPLI